MRILMNRQKKASSHLSFSERKTCLSYDKFMARHYLCSFSWTVECACVLIELFLTTKKLIQTLLTLVPSIMCTFLKSCINCIKNANLNCTYYVPVIGDSFCSSYNVTGEFDMVLSFGDSEFCPVPTDDEDSFLKLVITGKNHYFHECKHCITPI